MKSKEIGVLIVLFRFEFYNRRDVWSNISKHTYVLPSVMGNSGMLQYRFNQL